MRWLPLLILLQGCSLESPLFQARPAVKSIIIEKPPTRVIYSGAVTQEGQTFAIKCLKEMRSTNYRDYKFNSDTNINVKFETIDNSEAIFKRP